MTKDELLASIGPAIEAAAGLATGTNPAQIATAVAFVEAEVKALADRLAHQESGTIPFNLQIGPNAHPVKLIVQRTGDSFAWHPAIPAVTKAEALNGVESQPLG